MTDPGSSRPTRVRYLVLGLGCGLSFLLYLHRYSWGFIKADLQKEFGWDPMTLGLLDSLFLVTYGGGQIPSGMACDWFGARYLLGGSAILWSLALAIFAVASSLVAFAVARLVFGGAQAACYPVLNKVSKNWFPLGMRSAAQGVMAALCGRSGGAAAFLLFGVLLGLVELPWRTAVLLLAVLGVVCGALFLLLFRNTPREHPWANQAEADLVAADDPEAAIAERSRLNWIALLRNRSILFLFVRAVASNMADALYVYWLPLYLRTLMKVDLTDAGWMAALPLIGGALGGATSGLLQSWLLLRTGNRRWVRSGVALAGKLIAAVLMLSVLGLTQPEAIAGVFLAVKFFSDWEQPAEWGAATDLGGRNSATVFACINTAGAIGGVIAGPLIGFVLHSHMENDVPTTAGWNAVFVLIVLEYLVAAACWLGIDCRQQLK